MIARTCLLPAAEARLPAAGRGRLGRSARGGGARGRGLDGRRRAVRAVRARGRARLLGRGRAASPPRGGHSDDCADGQQQHQQRDHDRVRRAARGGLRRRADVGDRSLARGRARAVVAAFGSVGRGAASALAPVVDARDLRGGAEVVLGPVQRLAAGDAAFRDGVGGRRGACCRRPARSSPEPPPEGFWRGVLASLLQGDLVHGAGRAVSIGVARQLVGLSEGDPRNEHKHSERQQQRGGETRHGRHDSR